MEPLTNQHTHPTTGRNAFSLVELMIALVILAIILSFSTGTLSNVLVSTELSSTGDQVSGMFTQARQMAIADNSHIEIRFYHPNQEGGDDMISDHWTIAFTRRTPLGGREVTPPIFRLPGGTTISKDRALSTIIDQLDEKIDTDKLVKTANSNTPPTYSSFIFNADGSTDLPVNANGDTWHLTVISKNSLPLREGQPPSNFYTIRVDPFNGSVKNFRP